jgi:hypothetical protein
MDFEQIPTPATAPQAEFLEIIDREPNAILEKPIFFAPLTEQATALAAISRLRTH